MALEGKALEDWCNQLAELDPETKFRVIEGVMRMALTELKADTQSMTGTAAGKTIWMLVFTEDRKLIDQLQPILRADHN